MILDKEIVICEAHDSLTVYIGAARYYKNNEDTYEEFLTTLFKDLGFINVRYEEVY